MEPTSQGHSGSLAVKGKVRQENALFEQCYRGRVIPEEDWESLLEALRKDLPVTFRFAPTQPLSSAFEAYMRSVFLQAGALQGPADADGQDHVIPPEPLMLLGWINRTWKLDLPKTVLRRAAGPKRLHNLLKTCTELGVISRQEAVSMVPALALDCSRGERILDLCASPGMKTLQLLEAIVPWQVDDLQTGSSSSSTTPQVDAKRLLSCGAVVANELDGRRCCMLAHHVLRSRSPGGLVLHHNALDLPQLDGLFDRVLCDVPCSGDGTIRKAPQLMASWRPNRASALHHLQLRIACAGAERLKEGGRMVYSTCALSPVENEAVVAALLLRAAGAFVLVDGSDLLPGLQRRPGLKRWDVPAGTRQNKPPNFLKSPAEARARNLTIPATAWPPEESTGIPAVLHRCWRFYPHLGDSGGFFVAILRRVEGVPLPENFVPSPLVATEEGSDAKQSKKEGGEDDEEEPELANLLPEDAICKEKLPEAQREAHFAPALSSQRMKEMLEEVLTFYGLESLPIENFFVRNEGEGRNVYLVSDAVRDVLLSSASELHAMVGGVRVFVENRFLKSSACSLRLVQEGVRWLEPLMTKRRHEVTREEMALLLQGGKVAFANLEESSELRRALQSADNQQGSVALACDLPHNTRLAVAAECGAECISLFVNQHEMKELKEALAEYLQ